MRHLIVALCLGLAASASAAASAKTQIVVTATLIQTPPPGAPTAAGYATISNTSARPDRLLGGSTPAAARLEVHQMSMAGGIMRMRAVAGGLAIGPRQTLKLSEGGYHFMLIGPVRPFKTGDKVSATLRFERAGAVPVTFTVAPR